MQTSRTIARDIPLGARSGSAVTLIELLCVVAIIGILMSLLLPVILRAYNKVRGMSEEMEVPGIIASVAHKTRRYCTTHTQYLFLSKSELIDKVGFAPEGHDWVGASSTEFVPFGYLDETNKIVLTFHFGRKHATVEYLTKGQMSIRPQE
jgi:prepilin-type N-terminal cleavage/methylation domain-containing protein